MGPQVFEGFIDGHGQEIGDVLALIEDGQGFLIVTFAAAAVAGYQDIREEMHLDLLRSGPLAFLAAAAGKVEAEPARRVAPHPRFRRPREQLPERCEQAGVGRGIGAGRPADGFLVHGDDFVDLLDTEQRLVGPDPLLAVVKEVEQALVKDVVDQGTLSRPGDAGHGRHRPQRDAHFQLLEVVFRCPDDRQPAPGLSSLFGYGDLFLSPKILRREGVRGLEDPAEIALGHFVAAVLARARP